MTTIQKLTVFMVLSIPIYLIFTFTSINGQSSELVNFVSLEVDVYDISWSSDGNFLAVASSEGIKILTDTLQEIYTVKEDVDRPVSISWKPDGTQIVTAGGSDDGNIRVWNYDADQNDLSLSKVIPTDYVRIPNIVWSPDGLQVATLGILDVQAADLMAEIVIWNADNWGETASSIYWYADPLMKLVWSPNSQMIAGGGRTTCLEKTIDCEGTLGGVYILNAETGEQIQSIPLNFVPDDISWSITNLIATASLGDLWIFDTVEWQAISKFHPLTTDLAWDVDGKYIVSLDQNINLINSQTGQSLITFEKPFFVERFQMSSNDNKVVLWNAQGEVAIWDIGKITDNNQVPTVTPLPTPANL